MRKISCLVLLSAAVLLLLACQPKKAEAEAAPQNYRQKEDGVEAVDISEMADRIVSCLTDDNCLLNLQLSEEEVARRCELSGAVVLNDCGVIRDAVGREIDKIVILQKPESLIVVYSGDCQEIRSY